MIVVIYDRSQMRKIISCIFVILFSVTILEARGIVSIGTFGIKSDPAWLNDDFYTDVLRNPVELNKLNNQFLFLSSNFTSDYKFSGLYCKKLHNTNLAILFQRKNISTQGTIQLFNDIEYRDKFDQNLSSISIILGKNNIAFSYSIYANELSNKLIHTYSYENNYYDRFSIQEEVNSIKKINHNFRVGWIKELSNKKTLSLLSNIGIGEGDYQGSFTYQELRDGDPDDDGIYNDFYYDGHNDVAYFNRNILDIYQYSCPNFSFAFSGRLLRKINDNKRSSLVGGVLWEGYEADYLNSTFEEDCTIAFLVSDSLITENTNDLYSGKTLKYNKISGFIGYGKNWIVKKKWSFLLGWKTQVSFVDKNVTLINETNSNNNSLDDQYTIFEINLSLGLEYTFNKYLHMRFEQNLFFKNNPFFLNGATQNVASLYQNRMVDLCISPFRNIPLDLDLSYYGPYDIGNTLFVSLKYKL